MCQKIIAELQSELAQKVQLGNVSSQQSTSKDASIQFLRAQNVELSEHNASLKAQNQEFKDAHQAQASDVQGSLSEQQALTMKAEAQLAQQQAFINQAEASLDGQKALTQQAETKLFEQETLTKQAEASLDSQKALTQQAEAKLSQQETLTRQALENLAREEDCTKQAEVDLKEQKARFAQLEGESVDQAAATNSAEAHLLYMLLIEDDVVHDNMLQVAEISSLRSQVRSKEEEHSADLAIFEALHAESIDKYQELASFKDPHLPKDPKLVDEIDTLTTQLEQSYEDNALLESRLFKTERSDGPSGASNVSQTARITALETEVNDLRNAYRQERDGYELRITGLLQENHTMTKDLIGLPKSNSSTEAGHPTSSKRPVLSLSESSAKRPKPSKYTTLMSDDDVKEVSPPRSDGYYECLIPDESGQRKYTLKASSLLSAKTQEQLKDAIVKLDKWGQSRKRFRWQSMGQTDNNTCSMRKFLHRSSKWEEVYRACFECKAKRQPCLVVHTVDGKDRAVLLPLKAEDRKGLSPFDPGYWIKQ